MIEYEERECPICHTKTTHAVITVNPFVLVVCVRHNQELIWLGVNIPMVKTIGANT